MNEGNTCRAVFINSKITTQDLQTLAKQDNLEVGVPEEEGDP